MALGYAAAPNSSMSKFPCLVLPILARSANDIVATADPIVSRHCIPDHTDEFRLRERGNVSLYPSSRLKS
jgi:hypothetical protein